MAATQAKLGYGTLLQRETSTGSGSYVSVPEVRVVPPISSSRDLKEVTHMESPSGFKEYILGLKDGAELDCAINFTNDVTQVALMTDHDNGTSRAFKIIVPTTPTITFSFNALVIMWQIDPPIDDAIKGTFKLKVTGAIARS